MAVATAAVAAGEPLDESNVAVRPTPSGMVPAGALEAAPVGESSATELVEGEILLEDRLSDAAMPTAPAGSASIRLEPVAPAPALEPGDSVDVLAFGTGSPSLPDRESELGTPDPQRATVVARGALVLVPPEGEDHSLTVAVRSRDVSATAAAALGTGVVVVMPGR